MTTRDKLVTALTQMNRLMKEDNKNGHQWVYTNHLHRGKTFQRARKNGNYKTNCCDGVHWGCKLAGIPDEALCWYGSRGRIAWCGENAEKEARKVFNIIPIMGRKTVRQLYQQGLLEPGDILTYMAFSHTNAYLGDKKSFDSGHAYCDKQGELAPFKRWKGSLAHKNDRVGYILRIKENYDEINDQRI